MKNLGTTLAAAFLALVLVLYMCTFQVRFTEVAIKKTWGSPARDAITEPGPYFKWPAPIQTTVVYDKRLRVMEDRTEETRTVDGKHLLVTTFTVWRIVDPAKFHTNFPAGVEDGEKKLRTTIVTQKHAVIGKHEFIEFVSTDPAKRKLREIEHEIRGAVTKDTLAEFGIEIVDFG
ncbi:MAG: SPFH domain-containing protein, partial [Phycisphaerae bacterium]